MDDEDSQDELINKNISNGKGKRLTTSIISDEEEDGDDSHEDDTDSEEDDSQDGEDEGDEEEEDESDHEDGEKEVEGAAGTEPTDLGLSSDEDAEKCPICLNSFHEQPVATPQNCEHYFCLDCILEWAKNANSCPIDRIVFSNILLRKCFGGKVQKTITVERPGTNEQEVQVNMDLDQTSCEVCGGTDREDRLLLCDGCDAGYHMECLTPPLDAVPVEEWFCPGCSPNNRRAQRSSEEESSVLPTTSRSWSSGTRPTRAIARTQHSERVRANVNRHRITQARTAAQLAPRYLMQSTWLDETINAVVAGLNTAVYVRDLTPRPRARRRRRKAPRRKTLKDGKEIKGKTSTMKGKRRKRRVRRTKSRKKALVKKKTTHGRLAQNLGLRKPSRSSVIPSVYRPCEQTLGSMRADIGAASLSIYGDPFDLDPIDDGDEEMDQVPVQPSLLEAKRRGLSRSALRSHQPVARPLLAGLSRRGRSIPLVEEDDEAAANPDLLGSILSSQSLLLMDSSDVVINRDGSLTAPKHASLPSPRSSITGNSGLNRTPSTGAADFNSSREPAPSSSPNTNSSQSIVQPTPAPVILPTSCPPTSHAPTSVPEHPRLATPLPHRPASTTSAGSVHSQWGTCSNRGQSSAKVTNGDSDPHLGDRRRSTNVPAKKPPPKPVWVDVSVLPRIPKIKRENISGAHGSTGSNNITLPESSITSLAGDKARQSSVDQQGTGESRQGRLKDGQRQRPDRAVSLSSFSSSFSTPSTSATLTLNSQPSSSSSISFRISSSGNPWHARRLSAPDQVLHTKGKETVRKNQKNKQTLLSSFSQAKKASVGSEVYDPFNPTGSDASEDENDMPEINIQSPLPTEQTVGQNEDFVHEIKTESMDLDNPVDNEMPEIKLEIKKEPTSPKEDLWPSPSHQPAILLATPSESLAALVAYSGSPLVSDAEDSGNSEGPLTKALDRSRSHSPSSHHSEQKIKREVKAERDLETSPVKSTSPVVSQVTKGNGFIHELSSMSGSSNVNYKSKEEEIRSSCARSGEERKQHCASNSPSFKGSERSDKQKKHSRSADRRRSRSRSPRRRRSRSRSIERSHFRDRRRSSRSSSSESSRKRRRKNDNREKEGQKTSKKKRYSRSRSRSRSKSRSRERRRERTQRSSSRSRDRNETRSRDRNETRSKRKRSRSNSRDRRWRENISEGPRHRERHADKRVLYSSATEKESTRSIEKHVLSLRDSQKGQNECNTTLSVVSVKEETDCSSQENLRLIKEPGKQISEDVLSISVTHKSHESKPIEIKEEKESLLSEIKESQVLKDQLTKQIKLEQIWPDEDEDSCSDDDDALVINLSPPDPAPTDCEKISACESTSLTVVPKEEMKVEPLQASCPVKQEPIDSSDEEINVDYLIDNLDFIKKEMKDEPVTDAAGTVESQVDLNKESAGVKQEMEPVLVMAGTKAKSQGKRVTWNIQEPVVSQPDKISKLALFKLKLKQEGSRKTTSSSTTQITGQVAVPAQGVSKSADTSISSPALEGTSNQEKCKSHKEELLQNPDQKDKYMKKLHMQERAIEEVKLAIKPFYQKRDITKEEYKEILRKAVKKVCHSKSGEINPVKVANLVKAYVEKYKRARKHREAEEKQSAPQILKLVADGRSVVTNL